MTITARLAELGIEIPASTPPVANYVPFVRSGDLVFVSGQVAIRDGKIAYAGKLGEDFSVEQGQEAAKLCALNVLSQISAACDGDLERVERCIRLGIFVNGTDDFTQQPAVANGASDLMVAVFGDKGKHARAAVGTNSLPFDTAVEVEATFQIRD